MFSSPRVLLSLVGQWFQGISWHGVLTTLLMIGGFANIVGGWWYLYQSAQHPAPTLEVGTTGSSQVASESASLSASSSAVLGQLWIDVGGAVQQPGIYSVATGSRWADALTQAGGITKHADTAWLNQQVNLAQKLQDGDKIYIYSKSERQALAKASQSDGTTDLSSPANQTDGKVSINTATLKELDALPGIGEKRAQDIVAGRPYSSVTELVERKILTQYLFTDLKDNLTL